MRKIIPLVLIIASSTLAQTPDDSGHARTPAEIVNLRVGRYNARQLDEIMQLYSDDVAIYKYPEQLLGKGKAHLRQVLAETFKDSTPVTVGRQLVQGNYVISEERVSYAGTAKQFISIYEVKDELIQSVRFIRD